MTHYVDIQVACTSEEPPDEDSIRRWVNAAIRDERETTELSGELLKMTRAKPLTNNTEMPMAPPTYYLFL